MQSVVHYSSFGGVGTSNPDTRTTTTSGNTVISTPEYTDPELSSPELSDTDETTPSITSHASIEVKTISKLNHQAESLIVRPSAILNQKINCLLSVSGIRN